MKTAMGFVLAGLMLIVILYFNLNIMFYKNDLTIHMHDTFFVISYFQVFYTCTIFLAALYFIGLLIGKGLKKAS